MNVLIKLGVVLAGYTAALIAACIAVSIRHFLTRHTGTSASSGAYALGDLSLFFFVLVVLSIIPTILAIYFLWKASRDSNKNE